MKRENRSDWRDALLALAFLFLVTPAHSQTSVTVAPANLNYLVENAQTIVRGNVVSAVVEPHPQFANLETVVVTVAVSKTLKGQAARTVTFRQYMGSVTDVHGAGSYHKSEEVLLFLNHASAYGLTSPVGMEQGHFRVLQDHRGNRYALNGRGNLGLFTDVITKSQARGLTFSAQVKSMMSKNAGQVSLGELEDAIQALAGLQR